MGGDGSERSQIGGTGAFAPVGAGPCFPLESSLFPPANGRGSSGAAAPMKRRKTMKKLFAALALSVATLVAAPLGAQEDPVKIALIHGMSGSPLEAFTKQTHTGFEMGLEYATKGTMEIKGRKIELIKKDSQFKPDVARALLAEAYGDDDALLAVGDTSSGVALAMLPVAAEYEKILVVEPAVADSLTGPDSNRFVFKTSRNSSMDMQAQALALKPDDKLFVATLAEDYAFGKDGIAAFKKALEGTGATVVSEEYVPLKTTDYTATIERLFNALKDKDGRKVVLIYVAGSGDPMGALAGADPARYGIEISTGGNILPVLETYKRVPGMEGAIYYYYELPKNEINDWLVTEHQKRYNAPPDFFTAGGMASALAIAKALETAEEWDTETLIKTMEGMTWDTPKGPMTFRAEDHQALQTMYHFKIKVDDNVKWAIPELVREIAPDEMDIPVGRNNAE
jgi:branched-chain amino acid transport system substrate-binding protein